MTLGQKIYMSIAMETISNTYKEIIASAETVEAKKEAKKETKALYRLMNNVKYKVNIVEQLISL